MVERQIAAGWVVPEGYRPVHRLTLGGVEGWIEIGVIPGGLVLRDNLGPTGELWGRVLDWEMEVITEIREELGV